MSAHPLRSVLPIEMVDGVLQHLPRRDLVGCVVVNSIFYTIASRVLYHTIDDLRPSQSILCLLVLSKTPHLRLFVRHLEIDWYQHTPCPTGNLYTLLHRVLTGLPHLTSLSLELPRTHAPFRLLTHLPFSLTHFTTSLPCDQPLAHFLDTQPTLTDLTLRGLPAHPADSPLSHHQHLPQFFFTTDHPRTNFTLCPTSLPKLHALRTVHGGPSIITSIVQGRPVQVASIALFPGLACAALQALATSTKPLRRLSIMSFDPGAQEFLLRELVERFPRLEALHVVVLLCEYTHDLLKESAPLLAGFKSLQYITFMAATDPLYSAPAEQDIARLWHEACPTLRTIILPRGRVWFEGRSEGDLGWG